MEQPDEKMWELEISQCDDGDILIAQGRCGGCDDEIMVRLHRSQIPLIARLGGFVAAEDTAKETVRLQDRLSLIASLVRAHTQTGDPLHVVVDDLVNGFAKEPISSHLETPALSPATRCLPSAAECTSGHPERCSNDLFSAIAGGV